MRRPEVWFAIPTANAIKTMATFDQWAALGYKTAALVDSGRPQPSNADKVIRLPGYQGWPKAVNLLCREVDADVVVTGGDDILPDSELVAGQIGRRFLEHFGGTLGVMQPTGDRWMLDGDGRAASERICGSPWLGREFIDRINGGRGPCWPEYYHFFADEELRDVASKLGLLWNNPEIMQFHDHWTRQGRPRPKYLERAQGYWHSDQALYESRKAQDFPGHALRKETR